VKRLGLINCASVNIRFSSPPKCKSLTSERIRILLVIKASYSSVILNFIRRSRHQHTTNSLPSPVLCMLLRKYCLSITLIRECTRPLTRTLLSIVLAVGLERVVVIGGFALALGKIYQEILSSELFKVCDYKILQDYTHDLVMLGDEEACLGGAVVYAQQLSISRP
jgi:hypothetical protein